MTQSFELTVLVGAPAGVVWEILTRPGLMPEWMGEPEMAIEVETDWAVGAPIVVRGVHHVPFVNDGTVREFEPAARLAYTHRSSLSRLPDEPGSYTTLAFDLKPAGDAISLTLVATGFPTESIFRHLQFYWGGALECLKRQAEGRASR